MFFNYFICWNGLPATFTDMYWSFTVTSSFVKCSFLLTLGQRICNGSHVFLGCQLASLGLPVCFVNISSCLKKSSIFSCIMMTLGRIDSIYYIDFAMFDEISSGVGYVVQWKMEGQRSCAYFSENYWRYIHNFARNLKNWTENI